MSQRWRPFSPMTIPCLTHMAKKCLASGFTSWFCSWIFAVVFPWLACEFSLCLQTWHCDDSTITFFGLRRVVQRLYKTSTDQKFIINRVLTLFVVQGVLVTTLQTPYGNFLLKYHKWPQAKLESKAEWCPVFGFEKHSRVHCRIKWKHVHVLAMYYIDICTKHVISCHITCVLPHLILDDGGGSVAKAVATVQVCYWHL